MRIHWVGWAGVSTLMVGLWLQFAFPGPLPGQGSFRSPVLAMEFLENPADFFRLFHCTGTVENNGCLVQPTQMDYGNRVDLIFILTYTIFLFSFGRMLIRPVSPWLGAIIQIGALWAGVSDWFENMALLGLTKTQSLGEISAWLHWLPFWVWNKFTVLGLVFVNIGISFHFQMGKMGRYVGRVLVAGLATLGLLAWVEGSQSTTWKELWVMGMGAGFAILTIFAFLWEPKQNTKEALE